MLLTRERMENLQTFSQYKMQFNKQLEEIGKHDKQQWRWWDLKT